MVTEGTTGDFPGFAAPKWSYARVARAGIVRDLALLVKDFPGDSRVNLLLEMSDGPSELVLGPQYEVKPVPDFFAEAKALLGEVAVL